MKVKYQFVLALTSLLALSAQAAKPTLDINVSVAKQKNGDVEATLTMTNYGKGQQKILGWYTDLSEEDIFDVELNGVDVQYMGPHHKRPAPTDKDYLKLKSGQSLTKVFELTSLYDMNETGNYEVTYDVSSLHLFKSENNIKNNGLKEASKFDHVLSLNSNTAHFYLDGVAFKGTLNPEKQNKSDDCIDGSCFTGSCSNGEKNDILSALSAADQIANNAVSYLNSHSANNTSSRYTTWFGQATSSRYSTALNNFNAINDVIDNKSMTFDCSCNSSSFAYVYSARPYKVYLCRAFWNANVLGTDSRAGTIIHELSHFNVVAGTDDIAYGQYGAKSLAHSSPTQALNNADNHEYFAENTPNLN
jgi:peptidyl-Lys metalloendopeptidase